MTVTTSSAAAPGCAGRALWGAFIGGGFVETPDAETLAVMEPGLATRD